MAKNNPEAKMSEVERFMSTPLTQDIITGAYKLLCYVFGHKRLTNEECDTIWNTTEYPGGADTYKFERLLIRAAVAVGENRGLRRAAEIARAHPTEKPHHRYSHWIAIHGAELRELIAAAIDREREETR